MKKIYEFVLPKSEEVDETTVEKKDGKEVKTTVKVTKNVDHKFYLRKPTRKLYDEAELFYGVRLAEGIKAGLLTRALLAKRFSNDGGVLSDREKAEFGELYSEVFDAQVELQALSLKTTEQRTAEENSKHEELSRFLEDSRKRIQEFETNQSTLFDQTAENRARNKTILWWVLQLAHEISGDKESSFFEGKEYEDRLSAYDEMEENDDDWQMEVINKFFYYVSFWYVSKTNDPEQFKALIKFAEQADMGEDLSRHEVEFDEDEESTEEPAAEESEKPVVEKVEKPKKTRRKRKKKEPVEAEVKTEQVES